MSGVPPPGCPPSVASGPRPVAVVTGASSGLGRELALLFAADGHDLVLVARGAPALQALADELTRRHGITAHVLPADLADPGAPAAIADALTARGLAVDALVNNAGFGGYGPFVETAWAHERAMLQVNCVALTELTKRILPGMVARGTGRICNVASTAAFQPGPLMAVYYATKSFVLHFSIALAVELEGTGVTVTALCPGPTRTGFADAAGLEASRLFAGDRGMDVEAVARYGYAALCRGRLLAIPGVSNRLLAFAARFVPRGLAARLARNAQARRPERLASLPASLRP